MIRNFIKIIMQIVLERSEDKIILQTNFLVFIYVIRMKSRLKLDAV